MLTIEDRIVETTMLIEAFQNGSLSRGTGFKLALSTSDAKTIPILVTNKHVVNNAQSLRIHFSLSDLNDSTIKIGVASCEIQGPWESLWVPHPDESVDLGALLLTPFFMELEAREKQAYGNMFHESEIISANLVSTLSAIEEVLMVGYPIGLYDSVNNQPITRRGTTATNPRLAFQGRQEFLIDCACWPGSSGSPILIKTAGFKSEGSLITLSPSKFYLSGVLYAGPTHSAEGQLEIKPIPTNTTAVIKTPQMIHLGNVINATRIHELCSTIKNITELQLLAKYTFRFHVFSNAT